MYKYIVATLLATTSLVISSQAQDSVQVQSIKTKKFEGQVLDAVSKEPLPGATIIVPALSKTLMADDNGKFSFDMPDSITVLEFEYIDYEKQSHTFSTNENDVIILLKEKSVEGKALKGVEVYGRRKTTSISTSGAMKIEKIGAGELMKAACCNLSESFETTPSVDVGFTDAVSGYKQIQMLGLAGAHTSFTRENIPDIRGLASITGLTFTPGTFVESMQLSKGAGSVVNGYEGTAGQINVEWVKPFEEESSKVIANAYQSTQGRSEGNLIYNHKFNNRLSTSVMLHGRGDWMKVDMNDDGFLDNPRGNNFIGSNRWFYFSEKGLEIQGGFKGVKLNTVGGEQNYETNMDAVPSNPWGYQNDLGRLETWAKIGKVFPGKPYKSMGLQLSANFHDQENVFGARTYSGNQKSYYLNYIYQTIIKNTNHVIKFGASTQVDNYNESFNNFQFKRTETVPGAFVEYAYKWADKINVVAGLRGDYNSIFGAFVTPRLHVRYAPNEKTAIRASVGRAQRTANFITENLGFMASSRDFLINGTPIQNSGFTGYPFDPEVAWNMGVNLTKKFMLNYRDGSIGVDYYFTNFTNQVVVDFEKYDQVNFYNLNGKSYSHSVQVQLDYEPIRMLDVRLAYRFYDIKTTYQDQLLEKPLVAKQRAFANLSYATKNDFKFDFTINWIGSKRMPIHYENELSSLVYSHQTPSYWMMNAQINKSFKKEKWNVYVGVENIANVMQMPLIMDSSNPYGQYFDASLVWGSGMGRNIYAGFKYNLKHKKDEASESK